MRTYIDAPDGGYWGLRTEDFAAWVAYKEAQGVRFELTGISHAGELYYQMFKDLRGLPDTPGHVVA